MNVSYLEQLIIDIIKLYPRATRALIKKTIDEIIERLISKGIVNYSDGIFSIRDPQFMSGILLDKNSPSWVKGIMQDEFGEDWLRRIKEGINIGSKHIFILRLESPDHYVIIDVLRREKQNEG